jgi:hypothetical protein
VAIYLHIIVWLWNDIYWRDLQEPAASSGHGRRHYAAMETNDRRQQQPAEFWLRTAREGDHWKFACNGAALPVIQ